MISSLLLGNMLGKCLVVVARYNKELLVGKPLVRQNWWLWTWKVVLQ